MAQLTLAYQLIPDGITTIVQVEIKAEFYVATSDAASQAEDRCLAIVSRLTGRSEQELRQDLQKSLWRLDGTLPDEPADRREQVDQDLYINTKPEGRLLTLKQRGESGDTHLQLYASTHDDDAIEIRDVPEARALAYYLNAFADWAELYELTHGRRPAP